MDDLDIDYIRQKLRSMEINRIKEKISERGVSQKWVAQKLNKTTNTLNGWCCNKVQPHLVDLYLLSILLNCHVQDLIGSVDLEGLKNRDK